MQMNVEDHKQCLIDYAELCICNLKAERLAVQHVQIHISETGHHYKC